MLDTNVSGLLAVTHRLLPGLIAREGMIVNLSSIAAHWPYPGGNVYAATKAFDLSLTEALAAELSGRPVDVLALCPTATRSRFAKRSGFGTNLPGAQDPAHVAHRALEALGRQRTLVLGAITGSVLTVPALVRAAAAQVIQTVLPHR